MNQQKQSHTLTLTHTEALAHVNTHTQIPSAGYGTRRRTTNRISRRIGIALCIYSETCCVNIALHIDTYMRLG